ncbi:MAG: O-antigen ligase family protein [Kiloniellaceae bacterium]
MILAAFALLLPPLGVLADKAVVPLAIAAAGAGAFASGPAARPWSNLERDLTLALGAFATWCLVSSAWTFKPLEAAPLALRVGLLLFLLLCLATLAQRLGTAQRGLVARALCLGFAASFLFIAIELAFGSPILTLLKGPAESDYATLSRLNRGVSAGVILVWPLAALAWLRGYRWIALALPAATLGMTLFSQSSASMLALGAGVAAALLAALGRSAARAVMAAAIVMTLFGSPFVAGVAQQAGLANGDALQATGNYRLHVWNVVSTRIAERPLFGWGFDASPDLPTADFQPFRPGEKVIPSHPHNGALQIMVETGLVGSLLVLILLIVVARRIDRLEPVPRACAVAMLVTILGVAATAYGIWQNHWLTMIGASAAVFVTVLPAAERTG